MKDKVRYFGIPVILALLGYTLVGILFCWIIYTVDDQVVPKFRPFLLQMILYASGLYFSGKFIKPKFKLLYPQKKETVFLYLYNCILYFTPLLIALSSQRLVHDYTGTTATLPSINQIDLVPATKYYDINQYWVHTNAVEVRRAARVTGKNSSSYDMYAYLLAPIYPSKLDTLNQPIAWLSKVVMRSISNQYSRLLKENKFDAFESESIHNFMQSDFSQIQYFKRVDRLDDYAQFAQLLPEYNQPNVLIGVEEPFLMRIKNALSILFWTLLINCILIIILLYFASIRVTEFEMYKSGFRPNLEKDTGDLLLTWIKNHIQRYMSVQLVCVIALITFLDTQTYPYINMVYWGGNAGTFTINGQWWRLLTSNFLFVNTYQFLFVMIPGLLFFGILLESVLSKRTVLVLFTISGILCNLVALYHNPNGFYIDATGPVFAFCSASIVLLMTQVFRFSLLKTLLIGMAVFFFILFSAINDVFKGSQMTVPITGIVIGGFYGLYFTTKSTHKQIIQPK